VRGSKRPQPALRLRQLPLAADPVATAGLVPRDGDVDEPLEKVALRVRRGAPGVLERLVRLEERAGADQLEPARVVVRKRP